MSTSLTFVFKRTLNALNFKAFHYHPDKAIDNDLLVTPPFKLDDFGNQNLIALGS